MPTQSGTNGESTQYESIKPAALDSGLMVDTAYLLYVYLANSVWGELPGLLQGQHPWKTGPWLPLWHIAVWSLSFRRTKIAEACLAIMHYCLILTSP
jgi:hypothetical protein